LPPVGKKHPAFARDYEYKRMGTASILAALDLQCGHVIALVGRRHRSKEFIAYLASRPNRFCYVHTPTHGSWFNLVETLFGKTARAFLKHICVTS